MFNNNYFTAVFAKSKNDVLGGDGKMLWRHAADFLWFKGLTKGNAVIMGRKTFESLPNGALPDRVNVVVTRNKKYKAPGCTVVHSLADAARYLMRNHPSAIQYVIGGKELLEKALPHCKAAYITNINIDVNTDGIKDLVMAPKLPNNCVVTNTYELPTKVGNKEQTQCAATVYVCEFTGPIKSIFD